MPNRQGSEGRGVENIGGDRQKAGMTKGYDEMLGFAGSPPTYDLEITGRRFPLPYRTD
jgi:hypothetical protein